MRFPMTMDKWVKGTTALALAVLVVVLPLQMLFIWRLPAPEIRPIFLGVMVLTAVGLAFTMLIAPRAVRLSLDGVAVERWLWPDFRIGWEEIDAVDVGPPLKVFGGNVLRLAGNGGLMAYSGVFRVKEVGVVRCWATRLGVPTVVVRRTSGLPVLLGVDDPDGLLTALRHRPRSHVAPR
jgi:hypothetical protein